MEIKISVVLWKKIYIQSKEIKKLMLLYLLSYLFIVNFFLLQSVKKKAKFSLGHTLLGTHFTKL